MEFLVAVISSIFAAVITAIIGVVKEKEWLPFSLVFSFSIFILTLSFFDTKKMGIPISVDFGLTVQLAILGGLMLVSLLIPYFSKK